MDIATFAYSFFLLWWLILFCMLPIGIKRDSNIEEGNDPGAPKFHDLKRKALVTTGLALICAGGLDLLLRLGVIDLRTIFFGIGPS